MFVSDPAQVAGVRRRVLLGLRRPARSREDVRARRAPGSRRAPDDRPRSDHAASHADGRRRHPVARARRDRRAGRGRARAAGRAGERRGAAATARASTRCSRHELAQLYELMSRLRLATPPRRTRRYERRRRGERVDLRRTLRAGLRTAGDPVTLARRRRRVSPRRLVLLCDISGSMEPYARAYLQFLTSAAGRGSDAEAFVFATRLTRVTRALACTQPRARDPARRRRRAGLVERNADRRGAARVQRPSRTQRHGARRRGRDPLRRLGARRPDARGARDGAPGAPRSPDRVGQPASRRRATSPCGRAAWWPRCRTATRSSAATASTRSARSSRRSGPSRGLARPAGAGHARRRSRAVAERDPGRRQLGRRCRAATARAGARRRRAG